MGMGAVRKDRTILSGHCAPHGAGSGQAPPAYGQHPHSSTTGPRDEHWGMLEALRILTEPKHLPCSGLREASQVEQSPRRGLLSRVLYLTTATRICSLSGRACVTQSHQHTQHSSSGTTQHLLQG